jgi:hypothetical protein
VAISYDLKTALPCPNPAERQEVAIGLTAPSWHPPPPAVFPAGLLDNVAAGPNHFLFASLQDHSIIREDGSLHYFAAG